MVCLTGTEVIPVCYLASPVITKIWPGMDPGIFEVGNGPRTFFPSPERELERIVQRLNEAVLPAIPDQNNLYQVPNIRDPVIVKGSKVRIAGATIIPVLTERAFLRKLKKEKVRSETVNEITSLI